MLDLLKSSKAGYVIKPNLLKSLSKMRKIGPLLRSTVKDQKSNYVKQLDLQKRSSKI